MIETITLHKLSSVWFPSDEASKRLWNDAELLIGRWQLNDLIELLETDEVDCGDKQSCSLRAFLFGYCYYRMQNSAKSIDCLSRVGTPKGLVLLSAFVRGCARMLEHEFRAALEDYREALELADEQGIAFYECRFWEARALVCSRDYTSAIVLFDKLAIDAASRTQFEVAMLEKMTCLVFLERAKSPGVLDVLSQIIEREGNSQLKNYALNRRGILHLINGDLDNAVRDFNQIIEQVELHYDGYANHLLSDSYIYRAEAFEELQIPQSKSDYQSARELRHVVLSRIREKKPPSDSNWKEWVLKKFRLDDSLRERRG